MQPIRVSIVETDQPIKGREILKFFTWSPGELSLVGIQQRYKKEIIQKKIKSVHSRYRDLEIGIKRIQEFSALKSEVLCCEFRDQVLISILC